MAERKDTEKKAPARKKSAATKTAAGSTPAKKATATKSGDAAKATSKTADPKAAAKSKAPAKKKAPARAKGKAPAKAETKTPAKKAAPKEEPKAPVVNARARFVRVAPRKARLVANQVRGLPIEDARSLLRFSPRGAAKNIAKLIDSAAANAENNHDLVADDLRVADITVDEGPTLRRYRPRALGRATKIDKRTSHIHVALTPED